MLYSADFETIVNDKNGEKANATRVWAYAIIEVGNDKNFYYGNNIDDFMKFCEEHTDSTFYFHNLKFDGEFILYWLFTHGFEWTDASKLKSKQFKNWYEFRDAVEASIESGKDTYIYAVDDTPEMQSEWTYRLADCNESNVFCVSKTFNMEDFQKYLFIKYNVVKKYDDCNIIIDWVNDDELIYKRLFIFRLNKND